MFMRFVSILTVVLFTLCSVCDVHAGCPGKENTWIDKTLNLRDLGGWSVPGTGRVRKKLIFRSAQLSGPLTSQQRDTIASLGLKTIVDFRTEEETNRYPDAVQDVNYIHLPVVGSGNYTEMLKKNSLQFVKFLELLTNPDNLPLLFHCAAGKDRAGTAAAILLGILGVDRSDIMRDFLASNKGLTEAWGVNSTMVKKEQLKEMWDWVDRNGGLQVVLAKAGLTTSELTYIRSTLVEKVPIPAKSEWHYLDLSPEIYSAWPVLGIKDGSWRTVGFDDTLWKVGNGEFGFGDGDEDTLLACSDPFHMCKGHDREMNWPVYYFRRHFSIKDVTDMEGAKICIKVDDGAIVFLNGEEVLRVNVPPDMDPDKQDYTGKVTLKEDKYQEFYLPADFFLEDNLVAVQVFQSSNSSSDVSFDMELTPIKKVRVNAVVYGRERKPLSNLPVCVTDLTPLREARTFRTITDSNGTFSMDLLPGTYKFAIDFPEKTCIVRNIPSDRDEYNLVLFFNAGSDNCTNKKKTIHIDLQPPLVWPKPFDPPGPGWRGSGYDDSKWRKLEKVSEKASDLPVVPVKVEVNGTSTNLKLFPQPLFVRMKFNLDQDSLPDEINSLRLKFKADDAAIFYINGFRLYEWNVRDVGQGKAALLHVDQPEWKTIQKDIPPGLLHEGENVFAIEVYQWHSLMGLFNASGCTGDGAEYQCPSLGQVRFLSWDGREVKDNEELPLKAVAFSSDIHLEAELEGLRRCGVYSPGYRSVFMPVPQIIGTGVIEGNDSAILLALVRPPADGSPVRNVIVLDEDSRPQALLERTFGLANGDEIWTQKFPFSEGLDLSKCRIFAVDGEGKSSLIFPDFKYSSYVGTGPEALPPSPEMGPDLRKLLAIGQGPRVLLWGVNPQMIPIEDENVEVIALIHNYGIKPPKVILDRPDSFSIFMKQVGETPWGDLFFAVKVPAPECLYSGCSLAELGWQVKISR